MTNDASQGEAFVLIHPSVTHAGFREQFESLAREAREALRSLGLNASDIVRGWIRFADMPSWNWQEALTTALDGEHPLPITGLVQPPADSSMKCILELHLFKREHRRSLLPRNIACSASFDDGAVKHVQLMSLSSGSELGLNRDFEVLAYETFVQAGRALGEYGLSFSDVVRTWVHVSDIDHNYAAMNRARNRFFREKSLTELPASTCVEGIPVGPASPIALDLYAVSSSIGARPRLDVMHSRAMGEASSYGAAFSRAIRICQRGMDRLFVSGTASIDASGNVVSVGDVRGQMDRMFHNLVSLLGEAQMDISHVRSATAYLKRADYAADYTRAACAYGLATTVPCAVVVANICRPEWLCEIEVYAARDSDESAASRDTRS